MKQGFGPGWLRHSLFTGVLKCWSPGLLCLILPVWAHEVCEFVCACVFIKDKHPKYSYPVNHQPSWFPNQHLIYESQSSTSIFNLTAEVAGQPLQHKEIRNELILQGWIISTLQLKRNHTLLGIWKYMWVCVKRFVANQTVLNRNFPHAYSHWNQQGESKTEILGRHRKMWLVYSTWF